MKWSSERYARLYTRDTANWVAGPWQARAVLPLVLRKLDRAGTLDLDDNGLEGLAAMVGLPLEVAEPGMAWWAKKGTLVMVGTVLTMPHYVEAQECIADGSLRTAEWRERRKRDGASPIGDVASPKVTGGDGARPTVTPSRTVPSLTVPTQAESAPARESGVQVVVGEHRVSLRDPLPDELRVAAQNIGVRDIDGAWLKFCGQYDTQTIPLNGWWQKWCANERKREQSGPRPGPGTRPTRPVQGVGTDGKRLW